MKYNSLKYLLVAASLLLGLTSCDGYLDQMPSNALPSGEAINNIEDVNSTLNGIYSGLLTDEYYGANFIVRAEVGGEDVQTSAPSKRTEDFYRFMYRQNTTPTGLWKIPYRVINRVNVLLTAIESGKIVPSSELNNAKAEALAIRALCNFNLNIVYGYPYQKDKGASLGAPIVEEVLTANDMPSRNTVAEGYAAIEKDLSTALDLISVEVNNGRFNKWAILGLQTRVALYKGEYDAALASAEKIIKESPYKLLANADYVDSWKEEYTSESVFDLHISDLSAGNRELFGYLVDPRGYAALAATNDFINLLKENEDDVRLGLLKEDGAGVKCIINKYPGRGASTVNNVKVIRLSDIYLMAAEAALRKSSPDQAKADTYLNAIIKRAIPSATQVTATLALVDQERRKELVLEGHRLNDILRVGNTVTREGGRHFLNVMNDLVSPNWNDYRCVMPIPQAEIDANLNLKGQQNPEY